MKFRFFLFLSLFGGVLYAQDVLDYNILDTAKLKCYYSYDLQQDSTDINSLRTQQMVLLVGKTQKSIFKKYSSFLFDSISIARKKYPDTNEMMSLIGRFGTGSGVANFSVIKDVPNKKVTLLTGFPGSNFLIEEKLAPMKWELEEEEKVVANYKCKKATCHFAGRDYIAWYTLEIPISEGPYKFSGLPGLIVKIEDAKGEHRFELTEIENVKDENNPICYGKRRYINAKVKDFLKAYSIYNNGGTAALQQGGAYFENPNEAKIRKRMRARNNFIEKSEK